MGVVASQQLAGKPLIRDYEPHRQGPSSEGVGVVEEEFRTIGGGQVKRIPPLKAAIAHHP